MQSIFLVLATWKVCQISNYTKLSYTMMSLLFAASGLFFLETN